MVPMVSFCDIPLSELKEHITKYGNCGIGFTKDWAKKHRLNPVLYLEGQSDLSCSFERIITDYLLNVKIGKETDAVVLLVDVLRYIKNYQENLIRRDKSVTENYRFSDEREWRYVPPRCDEYGMLLGPADYETDKTKHDQSLEHLSLSFEPNDIKYTIIQNDNEISEFISFLRNVKGGKYSLFDIERLTTRILTTEQIKSDF